MNGTFLLRFALAAAMLSLLVSGTVQAACEWSDRIDKDSAECLSGGWENRSWPYKDTAWVKNECSDLGTVVAKVDRKDAADWTKWLEGDGKVNMSGADGNVRGIHCCSDLGQLCNRSDILNPDGCIAEFEESPAYAATVDPNDGSSARSCSEIGATFNDAAETCTINAKCSKVVYYEGTEDVRNVFPHIAYVTITVPFTSVKDVNLCYTPLHLCE